MRRRLIAGLLVAFCTPAAAEPVPADCASLVAPLRDIDAFSFSAPPAAPDGEWCVFDGASLRAKSVDRPNFSAERLRLRGMQEDGQLVALAVDASGLRVLPKAADRSMDNRLRTMFRLQTLAVSASLQLNRQAGQLEIRDVILQLQDGMELRLDADIQGAGLNLARLMAGSLTRLDLHWRNDGRFLRPLMELVGEQTGPEVTGTKAVDAARAALGDLTKALPVSILAEDTDREIEQLVAALPQGRGELSLTLRSDTGINAAGIAMAALSGDPFGRQSLGRLLAGSHLTVDWRPGLAP